MDKSLAVSLSGKEELSLAEELALESNLEAKLGALHSDQLEELDKLILAEEREKASKGLYEFVKLAWRYCDPAPFNGNWHLEMLCEHLEAVARRQIRNLVINVPPRTGKSLISSVIFPAWIWAMPEEEGTWLGRKTSFISSSYAQSLALHHSLLSRIFVQGPWYQRLFGVTISPHQAQKSQFTALNGGSRLAVSVGSRLTGFGFDILLIDDPLNAVEASSDVVRNSVIEWNDFAMSTRANDPAKACRILIMQRLHEGDLTGHLLDGGDVDCHLVFPMEYEIDHPFPVSSPIGGKDIRTEEGQLLWPTRYTAEVVNQIKRPLGEFGASGQLQQRPSPKEGGLLDPDKIEILDSLPEGKIIIDCRGWDFAGTEESVSIDAAYTASVRMVVLEDDPHTYILHAQRFREGPDQVKRRFLFQCKSDGRQTIQDIPQDPGSAGKYMTRDVSKSAQGYAVVSSPESGDKALRAMPLASDIDVGLIRAIRGDWWQAYRDELKLFPMGKYADQVDASSRVYRRISILREKTGNVVGVGVDFPKERSPVRRYEDLGDIEMKNRAIDRDEDEDEGGVDVVSPY